MQKQDGACCQAWWLACSFAKGQGSVAVRGVLSCSPLTPIHQPGAMLVEAGLAMSCTIVKFLCHTFVMNESSSNCQVRRMVLLLDSSMHQG